MNGREQEVAERPIQLSAAVREMHADLWEAAAVMQDVARGGAPPRQLNKVVPLVEGVMRRLIRNE
jgi:hypothetical protein